MPKNFVGEPFSVSLNSGIEKFYASEGYVTIFDFLSKFFCLTVPKILAGELFCAVFQKFSGSEKFYGEEGVVSRFSVENFLSHSAEIFRRGILYCCINFGQRKSLEKRGEYQDFPSKFFCLTVPKVSVGESFTVALVSGSQKNWIEGRGEYQDFPSKLFCLTVPKTSVGDSFTVALISGSRKSLDKGGGSIKTFRRKFFCLTVPKNFVGEPFSVSLISGIEKFYASEGYVTIFDFLSKFFCLTVPKILASEPFCAVFQKFSGSEKFYG